MPGETNLKTLLASMMPLLHPDPYVFCTLSRDSYRCMPFVPLGVFHEQEGVTVIAAQSEASEHHLPYEAIWACITLQVHSSLSAVGFLAVVTTRLAEAGISVNPVAGYYHDHLFVPWERREDAMEVLKELSKSA